MTIRGFLPIIENRLLNFGILELYAKTVPKSTKIPAVTNCYSELH